MPNRTAYALTPAQREELLRLYAGRALDRASALHGLTPALRNCNPNVLGILREKGFAEVFGRRAGCRTLTHYCLTPAGLEEVGRITGTAVG